MKISYTALSSQNQKLTGILEAESLESAQVELHKMGLSIIAISEISENEFLRQRHEQEAAEKKEGIQTFSFRGTDPNGKEILGTIDAKDAYAAYKRLVMEYRFSVLELYPSSATDEEKTDFAKKLQGFEQQMKMDGIEATPLKSTVKGELESEEKIDQKIVSEIDKFIIDTKQILREHKDMFSPSFFLEAQKTLNELERIRTSNNLKHISEVCNNLYEFISHPDSMPLGETAAVASYQNLMQGMKDNTFVKHDFEIHAKAVGLEKIKSLFSKIILRLMGKTSEIPEIAKAGVAPKAGIRQWLKTMVQSMGSKKPAFAPSRPGFLPIIKKVFAWLSSPNAMARQARKQELFEAWKTWKEFRKKPETAAKPQEKKVFKKEEALEAELLSETEEKSPSRWDFTSFFLEADSFIGWLLFFYILYFFLMDFSLEKGLGVPREFVVKTLKTPLIFNITLFLLFTHFLLHIKDWRFRRNLFGSLFLFFLGYGLYTLLVINF